ncbi:MAG: hypothetical protein P1P85_04920, partial [Patescibacteria group bacterium]|nr:hypothetical protein [Patescibacteria group bacterium]
PKASLVAFNPYFSQNNNIFNLCLASTDFAEIASVTIDLSSIGGLSIQPMIYTGNNVWSVTTNATNGTLSQTYNLPINVTNRYANRTLLSILI